MSRKPLENIIDDIDQLLNQAWVDANTDSPAELDHKSKAIERLPILLNGLGYYLAEAEFAMDNAKDALEYNDIREMDEILKSDPKLAKNKAEMAVELSEAHRKRVTDHLAAKRQYRTLKLKYDAVAKSFEGMRSRLSVIKDDLKRA